MFRVISISWLFCNKITGNGGGRPVYLLPLMTMSYPPLLGRNIKRREAAEQKSKLQLLVQLANCSVFGELLLEVQLPKTKEFFSNVNLEV